MKQTGYTSIIAGVVSFALIIMLITFVPAQAQVPKKINYQGYLADAGGTPVSGNVQIRFSIYDAASGGNALWAETQNVAVSAGRYSVLLGSSTPIALTEAKPYWLGVKIGADEEMTPRKEMTGTIYDLIQSGNSGGSDTDWVESNGDIYRENGNVGIGTSNPETKFHIKGTEAQDTVLWLQPGEWNSKGDYSEIRLGDANHYIRGEHSEGMTFYDANKFRFKGGPIGIPWATNEDNQSGGIVAAGAESDDFLYDGEYIKHMGIGFHQYKDNSSGYVGINTYIAAYYGVDIFTCGTSRIRVNHNGNVGIGTVSPTHKLSVNGTIRAKEIIVNTGWADFVFDENYHLMPLNEVEQHINTNGHLPGIPTAQEVEQEGLSLGDMHVKQMQKIEELTLYVIEMNKQLTALQQENETLKAKVSALEFAGN